MGKVGVELNEITFADLARPCSPFQAARCIELTLRGGEEVLQHWNGRLLFSKHPPGGNLTDVCWSEIDSVFEAIL